MSRLLIAIRLRAIPWKQPVLVAIALMLAGWWLITPPELLGKADAVGYAVCHRIDLRSFHLGDRSLPLCARCSGMYLGAVLGLAFQALSGWRRAGMPPRWMYALVGIFVAAFGIDGANSYFSLFPFYSPLYEPQNWLRLITGTGMGLSIAAMLYPAFNQTVWKQPDPRSALGSWKSAAGLLALAAALDALVLTESPVVLYPLALISAAGVFLVLTLVYTMVTLLFFRLDSQIVALQEAWMPVTAGFGLALAQIIALDLARYLLTGTWDGFHLG